MSISVEQAERFKNEFAVTCCRLEKGEIIEARHLEDPSIFPDLIDSGLLNIADNTSKIGEVIGGKLLKTVDSITPITDDIVEGLKKLEGKDGDGENIGLGKEKAVLKYNMKAGDTIKASHLENPLHFENLEDSLLINLEDKVLNREEVIGKKLKRDLPALTPISLDKLEGFEVEEDKVLVEEDLGQANILKIKIDEGKGIDIEVPLGGYPQGKDLGRGQVEKAEVTKEEKEEPEKEIRRLSKKYLKIEEVKFADKTKIQGRTLFIRKDIDQDALNVDELVKEIKIEIIDSSRYDDYSDTIMDVQPIASKEEDDKLGLGGTRVLDGVVMVITGRDENGVQIGEFGSSEGILKDNIKWGRPGAPDEGEIFIKTDIVIKEGTNMERPGPLAAHKASDFISQEIREVLKEVDEDWTREEEFIHYRRPGKKKVVIVKEIMGQGAMHDNLILPMEPVGILGGKANVDLGNLPIICSPLEILDGGVHALTCIGPASKETSRHYFREPLIIEALEDEEIDLCGVLLVGSPQINSEKFYVSERLGMTIETMDVDGAIVVTEGFGNNHIDFASHIEEIGKRGVPVVGASFCAEQGALVVGNKYMNNMVDLNKTEEGIENEVLAYNTLTREDGIRILYMLKAAMAGEEVIAPERQWNPEVKEKNLKLIEKERGKI